MKVTKVDGIFKASRITGPKHNYLGLVFTKNQPDEIKLIPRTLNGEPAIIDPQRMVAAVVLGIEEASKGNPQEFYAHSIEYVVSDTPDYSAYAILAKFIAESAVSEPL